MINVFPNSPILQLNSPAFRRAKQQNIKNEESICQYCHTLHGKCPFQRFFWSVFSRIRIEYGEILRIFPSVQMRENTDQKNSEYRHFLQCEATCDNYFIKCISKLNSCQNQMSKSYLTYLLIASNLLKNLTLIQYEQAEAKTTSSNLNGLYLYLHISIQISCTLFICFVLDGLLAIHLLPNVFFRTSNYF